MINSALRILIKSYRKSNKKRDIILISSISVMVLLTCFIYSFLYIKYVTDTLKNIREDGITVSTYLENGTIQLEEKIKSLSYVDDVGNESFVGGLYCNNQKYSNCVVSDHATYEKMIKPSYMDVQGKYPENSNEIMLSTKTLKLLGINKPKVGMKITLEFYWNNILNSNLTGTQSFILSGYYTNYNDSLNDQYNAYISVDRCHKGNIKCYPYRILIDVNTKLLKAKVIKKRLYNDVLITDDKQQFICNNTAEYRAMESISGGLKTSIVLIMLIFVSGFSFLYNIVFVSLSHDLKQYGLLKVIGVTSKQIKKIIYIQVVRVLMIGVIIGGGIGGIIVFKIVPAVLNKLVIKVNIMTNMVGKYHLLFFAIIFMLTSMTMLLSTAIAINKLLKKSPMEAMKRIDKVNYNKISKGSDNKVFLKNPIMNLAFRNVLRDKSKFIFTVLSLTIACEVSLCAFAITSGTDFINKFKQNPDFELGVTNSAVNTLLKNSENFLNNTLLKESLIVDMQKECNLKNQNLSIEYGYIPICDKSAKESLDVLNGYKEQIVIVKKISNNYWTEMKNYIEKENFLIDTKRFEEINGTIIIHNNLLKNESDIEHKNLGKNIGLYDLVPQGTALKNINVTYLKNCGDLDNSITNLERFGLDCKGNDIIYLLVSEKSFENLSKILTQQIIHINVNVLNTKENTIKKHLKQWLRKENLKFQNDKQMKGMNLMNLTCNSDVILSQKNYITRSRIIMLSVSLSLFFIGVMNYTNSILMNIIIRKKELTILESIGLSKKQIRKMLTYEGLIYCFFIFGLLMSIGTMFLFVIAHYIQINIYYFTFKFPFIPLLFLIVIMIIICIFIPFIVYVRYMKESIHERMNQMNW